MNKKVRELMETIVMENQDIKVEVSFNNLDLINDLGYDSLSFVQLILDIECKFNIIFPTELLTIDNIRNFDILTRIVEDAVKGVGVENESKC